MFFKKIKNNVCYVLLSILVFFVYWYLISAENFSLITNINIDYFDRIFADMLYRLMQNDFTISEKLIRYEAFRYNNNVYSYFSVFPAFLRFFFAPFYYLMNVSISRLSCFSALFISALFFIKTTKILDFGKDFYYKKYLCFLFGLCLVFNGPNLYLLANASIYHEVIVWALCFSSIYLYLFFKSFFIDKNFSINSLCLMAFCAGLALHNRVVVAISLYLALLVILCFQVYKDKQIINLKILAPVFILFAFGIIALYINYMRWGDPFSFANYSGYKAINESVIRDYAFKESGVFNIKRVFVSIVYYLTGSQKLTLFFDDKVDVFFDGMEIPFLSTLMMRFFTLFFSVIGIVKIVQSKDKMLTLLLLSFFISIILILSFMYLTLRYRADFSSFIVFSSVFGFYKFLQDFRNFSDKKQKFMTILLSLTAILSSLFSIKGLFIYTISPLESLNKLAVPEWLSIFRWVL